MTEIVPWLQEAIAHFVPNSFYAASLSAEIKESAKSPVPAPIGASVICPFCGAPNDATPGGMDDFSSSFVPAVEAP